MEKQHNKWAYQVRSKPDPVSIADCLDTTFRVVSTIDLQRHYFIDCSALHRASNFNFFRVRFCVDGRRAAAGLGLVEDRHDFETESTTTKMQVEKKGKELKGRNCEKVPIPARCALRTSSTVGTT